MCSSRGSSTAQQHSSPSPPARKKPQGSPTVTQQEVNCGDISPPLGGRFWLSMLRIQRSIRFFGAEGICGLPAWSWQSYMRTSPASHGNGPNTPRVAKAGDMAVHSLFCHSQILASLPSTCLRIERIKYIQRIIQNKPMGGKGMWRQRESVV